MTENKWQTKKGFWIWAQEKQPEIFTSNGNIGETIKEFDARGYRIASAKEVARERIEQGIGSRISDCSGFVSEAFVHTPKGVFLTKKSPIITSVSNAKRTDKVFNHGFYPTQEELGQSLRDSLKIRSGDYRILAEDFGKEEVTSFLFGEIAEQYGALLKEAGIANLWIRSDYSDFPQQKRHYINQMHLDSLTTPLSIDGTRFPANGGGIFGINPKADRRICKVTYSPNQISRVLKTLGIEGLEKQIFEGLK